MLTCIWKGKLFLKRSETAISAWQKLWILFGRATSTDKSSQMCYAIRVPLLEQKESGSDSTWQPPWNPTPKKTKPPTIGGRSFNKNSHDKAAWGPGPRYMELSSIETPRSPGQPARKKGSCGLQRNRQGLFRAKINLEAWCFFAKGCNFSFRFFRNFVKRLFDAFYVRHFFHCCCSCCCCCWWWWWWWWVVLLFTYFSLLLLFTIIIVIIIIIIIIIITNIIIIIMTIIMMMIIIIIIISIIIMLQLKLLHTWDLQPHDALRKVHFFITSLIWGAHQLL